MISQEDGSTNARVAECFGVDVLMIDSSEKMFFPTYWNGETPQARPFLMICQLIGYKMPFIILLLSLIDPYRIYTYVYIYPLVNVYIAIKNGHL
jgi:hypothetical protein